METVPENICVLSLNVAVNEKAWILQQSTGLYVCGHGVGWRHTIILVCSKMAE